MNFNEKVISGIISLVLLFSIIGQVPVSAVNAERDFPKFFVNVLELDSEFDGTISIDGDYIKLDTKLAIKQGVTDSEIEIAVSKVNNYNKLTDEILAIQPFIKADEKSIHFDEKAAKNANVSDKLITSTKEDAELMNSVGTLASCEG